MRKPTLKQQLTIKNLPKNNYNISKSMKESGYSDSTSHSGQQYARIHKHLEEVFKLSDITPERVIQELTELHQLAINNNDLSTATRCVELKGKYLALFTDKQQLNANVISTEEQTILNNYIDTNRLSTKQ